MTLVIPEPENASVEAVRDVLARLPEIRRQILERNDGAAALDMLRQLAALATYVGNRAASSSPATTKRMPSSRWPTT
jgi:hypothetical protein